MASIVTRGRRLKDWSASGVRHRALAARASNPNMLIAGSRKMRIREMLVTSLRIFPISILAAQRCFVVLHC